MVEGVRLCVLKHLTFFVTRQEPPRPVVANDVEAIGQPVPPEKNIPPKHLKALVITQSKSTELGVHLQEAHDWYKRMTEIFKKRCQSEEGDMRPGQWVSGWFRCSQLLDIFFVIFRESGY